MAVLRYAKHPSLKYALKLLKDTANAMGSMGFAVKQMPSEVALSVEQLRELMDRKTTTTRHDCGGWRAR